MAFKIVSEAEAVGWSDLAPDLYARFPHLQAIFAPIAAEVERAEVLRVRCPYGTGLIHHGKFCWESLPEEHKAWAHEYGDISIPLCLVTERCVELREEAPFGEHFIPLYLLTKGELFGLFQTFCDNLSQPRLQATAGGTTLILLPPIGDRSKLKACVRTAYESYKKTSWQSPWDGYADVHLKANDRSGFFFGEFFGDFLHQVPSSWRAELLLFPKSFVEAIKASPNAHLAAVETALSYLRSSYERSEQTVDLISGDSDAKTGHALALRLIAHGLRPGFAPVFGTDRDETVLPATDIHSLFYGGEPPVSEPPFKAMAEFFPALFRPSLPGETGFYFINWPYVQFQQSKKDNNSSVVDRAVRKATKVEVGHHRSNMFEQIDPLRFVDVMESVAPPNIPHAIKMPEAPAKNYFFKGGVIMVKPHQPPNL